MLERHVTSVFGSAQYAGWTSEARQSLLQVIRELGQTVAAHFGVDPVEEGEVEELMGLEVVEESNES